jgi:hypothetical protein
VAPLEGRTLHQAWHWLVLAISEFCSLHQVEAASSIVSRTGFRHALAEVLRRAEAGGGRRCLMIHGLEHLHVEALRDLIEVFGEHRGARTGPPALNLLLAGSIDAPHVDLEGLERMSLPDFAPAEGLEALVEHLGLGDLEAWRALVEATGGIPAVVDCFGAEGAGRVGEAAADRRAAWQVLGPLAAEIRQAFEIVASDSALQDRLEAITRTGPQPADPRDERLIRAGLVRSARGRSELRAPFLADLAGGD